MLRTSLCSAVAAAALFAGGAAVAQTTFDPPLDAPTPLSGPVTMELTPGAVAECVSEASITGMDLPAPPPSRLTHTVGDTPDGVSVRVVEGAGLYDITLLVSDGGEVTVDPSSQISSAELLGPDFLEQAARILPEVRTHRRTLNQGDAIVGEEEFAELFGSAMGPLAAQGAEIEMTGGSFVSGETVTADGRRIIVFDSDIDLSVPAEGVNIALDGVDAYDAATGLRIYSDYRMAVAMPPAAGVGELVFNQLLQCELNPG